MGRGIRFQQQSLYISTFGYFRGRKGRKREWKKKKESQKEVREVVFVYDDKKTGTRVCGGNERKISARTETVICNSIDSARFRYTSRFVVRLWFAKFASIKNITDRYHFSINNANTYAISKSSVLVLCPRPSHESPTKAILFIFQANANSSEKFAHSAFRNNCLVYQREFSQIRRLLGDKTA